MIKRLEPERESEGRHLPEGERYNWGILATDEP